jgi:hypothetical protein
MVFDGAHILYMLHTRVKTHKLLQICKQIVTNLFTSCRQVVFALLVPSQCCKACNKFGTSRYSLTTCNKLDGITRLVTRLFNTSACYSHDITHCYIMTVSKLWKQPCNMSDNISKVITTATCMAVKTPNGFQSKD